METIEIELTRIFIKVVQHGGFSKAANFLRIPKSTVSKAISRLEKETGTKLLLRTTRSQTLTPAGRVFYETCIEPIQILEDAQKSLYGQDTIVAGKIKITAPEDLGNHVISPEIGKICSQYPKLFFELDYSNQVVDMIKEGFDLAVRIGRLEENRLKVKVLGNLSLIPVATLEYIERTEKIRNPKDLEKHDCLSVSGTSMSQHWQLKRKKETIRVPVRVKVESNQMNSLLAIAMTGAGVALVPQFLCEAALKSHQLQRVLPEWVGVGMPVSLVSSVSTSSSARLKLVSDRIAAIVKTALHSQEQESSKI
ncbi:MAG: LysR family transcriptional regulator [Bdellovibrionaceae bacterium]|nr:LysR family transcriptional regulator [Pseudobdellovibrionaceae bacterium]